MKQAKKLLENNIKELPAKQGRCWCDYDKKEVPFAFDQLHHKDLLIGNEVAGLHFVVFAASATVAEIR